MAKKKKRKKKQKMSSGGKALMTVFFMVAVLLLGAVGYNYLLKANFLGGENIKSNVDSGEKIISNPDAEQLEKSEFSVGKEQINVLCIGFDESKSLTDVIMLVSIDTANNSANILQIPRDTYVGDWTTGKINAAYSQNKKIQNLVDVINEKFQLPVDEYISIGLHDFSAVIDAVGGVECNVPVKIPGQGQYPTIMPGPQILNGLQSEWVVRQRHSYATADIGREKMQRVFLTACMVKAQNLGLGEITKVIPAVYGNVKTNMNTEKLLKLAKIGLGFDLANVHFYTLPGESVTARGEDTVGKNYHGYSVYSIHKQETIDLLNTHFRKYQGVVGDLPIFEIVTEENYKVRYSEEKDSKSSAEINADPSVNY